MLAAGATAGLLATTAADVSGRTASLTKGVNIGRMFWLPQTDYGRDIWRSTWTSAQWKAYADDYFPVTEQRKLVRSGFDHVRVPVDLSEVYTPNLANPSAGTLNAAFLRDALDPKVKEIVASGLSVVIVPFRKNGDDADTFIDGLVFDPTWRAVLADFWTDFAAHAIANRPGAGGNNAYDPARVVLQLVNEPRLTELWRNGKVVGAGTNNERWSVRDAVSGAELMAVQAQLGDGGSADVTHVRASAFAPLQTQLAIAERASDPTRQFTLMTGTPIYNEVGFDAAAMRAAGGAHFAGLEANRFVTSGAYAEGTFVGARDYNTTRALTDDDANGNAQIIRTSLAASTWNTPSLFDSNVIYNFHYYTNGIFATNQGDYENYQYRMIYPMPLDVDSANRDAKRATLLAAVRGRLGLDDAGASDGQAHAGLVAANRQWVVDYGWSPWDGGNADDADAAKITNYYEQTLVPLVDEVLGYLAYDGSGAAQQADVDRVKGWANAGKHVYVIADEFGVRQHDWHTFGPTEWYYVRPFADAPAERTNWYSRVRKNLDGTLGGSTRLGWTAWDYAGDLGITEPKVVGGGVPSVTFSAPWVVDGDNVDGYARALRQPMADALGVGAFDFVARRLPTRSIVPPSPAPDQPPAPPTGRDTVPPRLIIPWPTVGPVTENPAALAIGLTDPPSGRPAAIRARRPGVAADVLPL